MPCSVEGEGAVHDESRRYAPLVTDRIIGTRMSGKNLGVPSEFGKVTSKTQRAFDAAGAGERREVERNHDNSLAHLLA